MLILLLWTCETEFFPCDNERAQFRLDFELAGCVWLQVRL